MKKLLWVLVVAPLAIYGFEYLYFGGNFSLSSKSEVVMCDMPGMSGMSKHDHQAMMAKGVVAMGQDPEQEPDQPGPPSHRMSPGDGCSSVNPNAPNKRRDGVNPNTVGCKCAKKCVNGQTQEDRSRDEKEVYICRNACHPDRCTCPDPCKS